MKEGYIQEETPKKAYPPNKRSKKGNKK